MPDNPPLPKRVRDRLEFISTIPRARVRKEFALACACHAARHIQKPVQYISFVLVNDRKMATLHRKFSHISGTTDVLTFDLSETKSQVEGEVVICLDQARRQAEDYGVPLYEEIARLAVHGVLHLAGFDDRTNSQRERMRSLEDRSLLAGRRVI